MSLKRIPRVLAFTAGLVVSLAINSFADVSKDLVAETYVETPTKDLSAKVTTIEVVVQNKQFYSFPETTIMQSISKTQSEDSLKNPIPEARLIERIVEKEEAWKGEVLNSKNGVVNGPNGKETYYNLDMSGVISIMKKLGYDYEYYIREDGVKMYGPYIMCAANLELRPRGTILKTTLGTAIVCDTGNFANSNPTQIDIAVNW